MSKLDDASWHYGGDSFPEDLSQDNGATHIGFFVRWAMSTGLWGTFVPVDSKEIQAISSGNASARKFLLDQCDGRLLSEMLSADCAGFAEAYYPKRYLSDYQRTVVGEAGNDYLAEESDQNYASIARVIGERYASWKGKRWWKPWW